jgi:hypothetical protein
MEDATRGMFDAMKDFAAHRAQRLALRKDGVDGPVSIVTTPGQFMAWEYWLIARAKWRGFAVECHSRGLVKQSEMQEFVELLKQ